MQLFSLAALSPEAQRLLDDLSRKLAHDYSVEIITFAGITLALWIAAAWVAAQAVVKESAATGHAIATGFRWFTGILAAVLLAGATFYFARLRGSGTMTNASIGIGIILVLYAAISAPIAVYKIPFVKGLIFAVIGLLVHLAGQVAVLKVMNDPLQLTTRLDQVRRLTALSPEEASQVLTSLKKPASSGATIVAAATPAPVPAKPPEATPAPAATPKPRGKTIAERHDDLKKVYADLMAERESLREGDDDALAAYNRATAQYVEKLAQLQKDKDAENK